jgi:hypothetical protein
MVESTLNEEQLAIFAQLQEDLGVLSTQAFNSIDLSEIAQIYRDMGSKVDEYIPSIEAAGD